jgi:glycosyltransferase involved in cell wall biosynthesis
MLLVRALAGSVLSTGRQVALLHPGGTALGARLVPYFPPVDLVAFSPNPTVRTDVRAEWHVEDELVIGTVANINPQKGIDTLIRAFATVRRAIPRSRLVIVGTEDPRHGRYSEHVKAQTAGLGLVEGVDVRFLGGRRDVERVLQGFDVFALASVARSEGIPTAILEAMACGLPVVATEVGGVVEVVEHGVTGFVVPPSAPDAMAKFIVRVLTDDHLRMTAGTAARTVAEQSFSLENCAAAHIRAFDLALSTSRRGRTPKDQERIDGP